MNDVAERLEPDEFKEKKHFAKVIIPERKFEAGLFDLDNLLILSEPAHLDAEQRAFSHYGLEFDEKDHINCYMTPGGGDTPGIVKDYFCGRYGVNADHLRKRIIREFIDQSVFDLELMPGAIEILEYFREHVLMGVVTSNYEEAAIASLQHCNLSEYFDARVTNGDIIRKGLKQKPSPDPYKLVAEMLGINPAKCVAFEDSPKGAQSAKLAGCFVITCPSYYTRSADFGSWMYDIEVSSLHEALEFVKNSHLI